MNTICIKSIFSYYSMADFYMYLFLVGFMVQCNELMQNQNK
jgi:hypothetical protein